jgi:hypothetical protein
MKMKKIRVRDLPDWPPQPGGAYESGTRFPVGAEAVINDVFPLNKTTVTFQGQFGGHSHSYHYKAPSEKIANQIHNLVAANIGKTVAELGEFEIEV